MSTLRPVASPRPLAAPAAPLRLAHHTLEHDQEQAAEAAAAKLARQVYQPKPFNPDDHIVVKGDPAKYPAKVRNGAILGGAIGVGLGAVAGLGLGAALGAVGPLFVPFGALVGLPYGIMLGGSIAGGALTWKGWKPGLTETVN